VDAFEYVTQAPIRRIRLLCLRAQLRLKPLVLEREARRGAHGPNQLRVVLEHRVV
jgi:hypothetical protein